MSVIISPCGQYRYVLQRSLKSALRWHRPCLFIMLNPSVADAIDDDPTIRRVIQFAIREGRTRLTVVNLFALVSTDPKALKTHADPVGPHNSWHISEQLSLHKNSLIVAAWGNAPIAERPALDLIYQSESEGQWKCLGKNKNGSPKHPLYLKKDTPLETY